jgi:hypothetical protein
MLVKLSRTTDADLLDNFPGTEKQIIREVWEQDELVK